MFFILPFSKGYLLNWDIQRQIWDYVFRTKLKLQADNKRRFSNIGLIIVEPAFNFPTLQEMMFEVLFEEYGFGKILILTSPHLAAFKYYHEQNVTRLINNPNVKDKQIGCLVVESGFSFTHVVPFVEGYKITAHMKRIDVGGKALTNYLKEIISYRQINVLDETFVVNQMKEDCCFVSVDFWNDLKNAKKRPPINTIVRDYVLPDYIVFKRGFIFDDKKHKELVTSEHQRILMNNERFQVPEILFNPGDVNIDQVGISHTILYSVGEFNPNYHLPEIKNGNEFNNVLMSRERPNMREIDSDEDYIDEEDSEPESSKQNCNGVDDNNIDLSKYNDENIQSHLYNNILLIGIKLQFETIFIKFVYYFVSGGNCCFPNIRERVYNDVRSNVADILDLRVTLPSNPVTYAWSGGKTLCNVDDKGQTITENNRSLFHKYSVSQKEYKKYGVHYCIDKMKQIQLPTFA